MYITKVTKKTLKNFYDESGGNLMFRYPADNDFQILQDFTYEECLEAMKNKVEFIFVRINWNR